LAENFSLFFVEKVDAAIGVGVFEGLISRPFDKGRTFCM
jgi:hypothetical protein